MAAVFSTTTTVRSDEEPNQRVEPSALSLIADYDIHHSHEKQEESHEGNIEVVRGVWREAQPPQFDSTLAPHPLVPYPVTNPDWWERTYRRVPDYRPINMELDLEERRQNAIFTIVGGIMVRGCAMLTVRTSYCGVGCILLMIFCRQVQQYGETQVVVSQTMGRRALEENGRLIDYCKSLCSYDNDDHWPCFENQTML